MKFVMYQDCVSPHQVPLARGLVAALGADNFRYVYRDRSQQERVGIGWAMDGSTPWFVHVATASDEARALIEDADCLLTMFRDIGLFNRRHERGQRTYLQTERWFKPWAGIFRMLSPSYRRMAKAFVRLMDDGAVVYLPIGIHAARDMARLCGLMHGDWRCLFRAPQLEFERKPGGRVWLKGEARNTQNIRKYCLDKMRMWGYYVEPSKLAALPVKEADKTMPRELNVLWVGRLLDWKRVDTIVRAVGEHANLKRVDNSLSKIILDIYGTGPEEAQLKKLAAKYGDAIKFYSPVPIDEVRKLMREHDVYVLSSNGYEGWGAVVSEALEEGMRVLGSCEAGSSATILPKERLFHAGDWRSLLRLLERECEGELPPCSLGKWMAVVAARQVVEVE